MRLSTCGGGGGWDFPPTRSRTNLRSFKAYVLTGDFICLLHVSSLDRFFPEPEVSGHRYNILILGTGNSARSIMAEALFNVLGKERFVAYSEGSYPTGNANRLAVERCQSIGDDTSKVRSKGWDEFVKLDALQMDFVIIVCDLAAGEVCPIWLGKPMTAHWGYEDPTAFEGTGEEKQNVFDKVFRQILNRVSLFVNLPLHVLDRNTIHSELRATGDRPSEEANAQR